MVMANSGDVLKWYIALFILFFFIFSHVFYLMIGHVQGAFVTMWTSYYTVIVMSTGVT